MRRRGAAGGDRRHHAERSQRLRLCGLPAPVQRRDRFTGGRRGHIRTTNPDGSWPFGDAEFDIVVSNQVCEHVVDLETFCSENARVLKPGGFGVHAFPLRHMLVEPHMHLPFVHRVRDHALRAWLIARFSALSIGIYRYGTTGRREPGGVRPVACRLFRTFTTYRTWNEVCDTFHRHTLRVSYRHTSTLIQRGLWRLAGGSARPTAAPAAQGPALPVGPLGRELHPRRREVPGLPVHVEDGRREVDGGAPRSGARQGARLGPVTRCRVS